MEAMADSVETRVRVLLLLNMTATVRPSRGFAPPASRAKSGRPDLAACLWLKAFFTRVASSGAETSAMERRCRGAKGELAGVVGVERCRVWAMGSRRVGKVARRRGIEAMFAVRVLAYVPAAEILQYYESGD